MAHVALENGEVSDLTREDFTVISNDDTGRFTLVIPRIAADVESERAADILVDLVLRNIKYSERF